MKRITTRVRHGRRQQHINLPPSGLGGIVMAMEQPQRHKRRREKAITV